MYRLIASDMDDTLLDGAGKLTKRTVDALRRAMDAGVYVVLASGRMLESARPFAEQIGVNAPMVLYNGAMVYDLAAQATVSSRFIPYETAKAICEKAEAEDIYVQVYPGEGYFAREHTKYTDLYEASIKVECGITGTPLSQWITGGQVKMLFIGEKEDTAGRIARFSEAFPDVSFMMSRPNYVEIVPKNVDKRYALEETIRHLGVKPEECVAFGDGQNDVSMLKYVGAGYCVENASQGVKDQCELFAPSNAEDGCARMIERLLDEGKLGKG